MYSLRVCCTFKLQEQLPSMIQGVFSDDIEEQLVATTKFRKLLSKEREPPIQQVIESGAVPKFVEFLRSSHSLLQVTCFSLLASLINCQILPHSLSLPDSFANFCICIYRLYSLRQHGLSQISPLGRRNKLKL
jgi:hypothetical protein